MSADDVTFSELGLPDSLLNKLDSMGFVTPTPIQRETIPALLDGRDVTGVAQTGTGKTAAFSLPMLAHLDPQAGHVQGLVLLPTRELAIQVADAITSFAASSRTRVLSIYGGSPYGPQLRALREGVDIVVGTPGRVIDMLEKGALDLSGLTHLVLDEADEMLRMGFAEDVDQILSHAPGERQTALFSATMPKAIRSVARRHMRDPLEIATSRQSSTTSTINQTYAVVPFRHKVGALSRVLATSEAEAAVVFVRTRATAEEVGNALLERGVSAAAISGDVAQKDRERIIDRLRGGLINVLVATDVAARGMDVERIGLVVNFDIPREVESYVHRIGRTGRAGRSGQALTFFTPRERGRLRSIEKHTGATLTPLDIPTPAQVSEHRAKAALASLPERIEAGRLQMYRELLTNNCDGDLLDFAAALLARHIGDEGPHQREENIVNEAFEPSRERDGGHDGGRRSAKQFRSNGTTYRVGVGHTDGVRPQDLVGAITGEGGLRGAEIGKISIFSRFSLVDIPAGLDSDALRNLAGTRVAGRALGIRLDEGPKSSPRGRRDGFKPRGASRQSEAGRNSHPRRGPHSKRDTFSQGRRYSSHGA